MKSGIFVVMNIGQLRLYIGETHLLKQRWEPIMQQLQQGCCKHTALQAEWDRHKDSRKVTFHTMADLQKEMSLIGHQQFLRDTAPDLQSL